MDQIFTSHCVVMVSETPRQRHIRVRLAGDLDDDATPALSDAIARVVALSPEHVFVDLADVAFTGATLPNFLARLVDVLPQAMSVTVCRPRPLHQWLLGVTDMAKILTISSRAADPTSTEEGDHRDLR
jgi:anti-anti-sigma factor